MAPACFRRYTTVTMRHLIAALTVLLCVSAASADPNTDALKAKFNDQQQILLSGVLADPAQASEFAKDAGSGADVKLKWLSRISSFSQDYLGRQHVFNDKAASVKDVGEPSEWAMLMTTLRKMQNGGILQQAKMKVFIGMIDDANDGLKKGDASGAHKVVEMGRGNLKDALNEFLASGDGKAGLAEAERLRREEQARKAEEEKQRQAELERQKQAELEKQKQAQTPPPAQPGKPKTPPKKADPVPDPAALKPAANPSKAIDEAERARQEAEAAARARTGGNSPTYENGSSQTGNSAPVVTAPSSSGSGAPLSSGLTPAKPGGQPSLAVSEPPAPGDDMAELHQMKEKVKGHKTLYATIGGGVAGGLLGFLIGSLLGGPIVGLLVGAAMAAGGAYAANKLGKKLWG